MQRIIATVPPSRDGGDDLRRWPGDMKGEFTVSAAYHLLLSTNYINNHNIWNQIWRLRVEVRVKFFIWIVFLHERLLTNFQKSKMRIGSSWCVHCETEVETILHVLRDCPIAMALWINLVPSEARDWFF